MTAVLPHYKTGPANYQVAGLVYGGQFVEPHTITAGTTDLTVTPSIANAAAGATNVLGVAGADANVITTQTGAANSYGQPLIDISVLGDYVSVYYGGVDIWCWFGGPANPGELLLVGASHNVACNGTVMGYASTTPYGGSSGTQAITAAYSNIIGKCTHPGGVSSAMLTQQIGGQGAANYFLGRARIF
jgi:hypothetical protein